MKKYSKSKKLNRNPYRGILTEIAKEQGVTPQAVRQAVMLNNVRIIEILTQKIKERESIVRRYEKELRAC